MRIRYHKNFQKQVANLPAAQRERLKSAMKMFVVNPYDPELYNHPLTGEWRGHRSIVFGGDWRAHYIVLEDDEVLFVAVGMHSQLYK
ncbi:MAG TPA: type II toxin-antitoxin system mRNA interferase toxin, RelE/StbE family [Candidatus Saccharimonadia bacterium]